MTHRTNQSPLPARIDPTRGKRACRSSDPCGVTRFHAVRMDIPAGPYTNTLTDSVRILEIGVFPNESPAFWPAANHEQIRLMTKV